MLNLFATKTDIMSFSWHRVLECRRQLTGAAGTAVRKDWRNSSYFWSCAPRNQ